MRRGPSSAAAQPASIQWELTPAPPPQAVVCDEAGNCNVAQLVRAAGTASTSPDLLRIDCMRPEVVASLHSLVA